MAHREVEWVDEEASDGSCSVDTVEEQREIGKRREEREGPAQRTQYRLRPRLLPPPAEAFDHLPCCAADHLRCCALATWPVALINVLSQPCEVGSGLELGVSVHAASDVARRPSGTSHGARDATGEYVGRGMRRM